MGNELPPDTRIAAVILVLLLKLQFVKIVQVSVNFDHDNLMIEWYYGHGQNGHFDHGHFENSKVLWS